MRFSCWVVIYMKPLTILPTILKSMVYQANWNTRNMQGTGFIWLLKDLFKRNNLPIPSDIKADKPDYFNTNPYFITFILGMVFKESERNNEVMPFVKAYSSALAAMGDTFFWHSLRPFVFFVSLMVAVVNPSIALVTYMVLYNVFHFWSRFFGFHLGYKQGKDLIQIFKRVSFNNWAQVLDYISVFMSGILLSAFVLYSDGGMLLNMKAFVAFGLGFLLSRVLSAPVGVIIFAGIIGVLLKIGV